MKALVIGATGAVGKDLVEQLLRDEAYERVDVFVRREVGIASPKLVPHVVDFDHPERWSELLTGDVLFSCLGTTIKAAAAMIRLAGSGRTGTQVIDTQDILTVER